MKYLIYSLPLLLIACQSTEPSSMNAPIDPVTYPDTRKDTSIVDIYHGEEVADPYRWLEDDNSEETMDWVDRQNKVTYDYLDQISYRDALRERLTEVWNYEKYGSPFKEGGKYYFFKNDGLQNQSVMYVQDDLDAEPEVFLDPNTLSDDGTSSLAGLAFSKDGRYFSYLVSEGGSDWRTAYIKDLSTGEMLDEKLEWIKFSGMAWYEDGFYYSRYPEPTDDQALSGRNQNQQVYYHRAGTEQSDDKLVHEDPKHPDHGFNVGVTEDGKYLVVSTWKNTSGNMLHYRPTDDPDSELLVINDDFEHDYNVVDHIDGKLYVQTNDGASRKRLVAIDPDKPARSAWQDIIPEQEEPLQGISVVGGKLVTRFLKDASTQVRVYNYDGSMHSEVELPGIGTVGGFSGKKDEDISFYSFTSFTTPSTIYKYDMSSGESTVFKRPTVDFDPEEYVTEQLWYTSKDGTKVPMFITHRKGLKMDGKRPTLLYAYGGFNISILPSFSITRLPLLENDGIYAVANIRGGGEYGSDWHEQGTLERKQNVFDDFIAAGEFLISEGYTSSDKLAIEGGSNGGLLVGACMTQRPDLYAVAIPRVGVLDMLRYHEFTIGRAWATDYGLSEDPEAYQYLKAYSPLHNVKPADYPATMVMTADHDDRVVPAHSFKFASELQSQQQGDAPVLIRIEKSAGHGAGKPTDKVIAEAADVYSFMFYHMDESLRYDIKG